jgi:CRP-like cAMP-binding protein
MTNFLLKQLPATDRELIEHHISCEAVATGSVLVDVGEPLKSVYFPADTIISLHQASRVEVATVGPEGMFGWSAIANHQSSPFRAVVRGPDGMVLKLPLDIAISAVARSVEWRAMLCQYLVIVAIHMSETIGSHSFHRLDARLARWLLVRHDRVIGDEIKARHEEIADSLGVRRASITDCLHIIEGDGHLRCRRGRITIRNRAELLQLAGACYGAAEAQYRSFFGPFGKSASRPFEGSRSEQHLGFPVSAGACTGNGLPGVRI